jgi:RNA polymerase sigma factor for flagellar operon FliA
MDRAPAAVARTDGGGDGAVLGRDQLGALLKQHRPLVRRLANQMIAKLPANVELDDLIQVGMIGLSDALSRFDAAQGVQFETFATQRIRGAMLDELRGNDWMSRGDRRDGRRIEAAMRAAEQRLGRSASDSEVAAEMGLPLPDYHALALKAQAASLVDMEDYEGEDVEDYLDRHGAGTRGDPPAERLDLAYLVVWIEQALEALSERERSVWSLTYDDDLTQNEIAQIHGVSGARISQLLGQAERRIVEYVQAQTRPGKRRPEPAPELTTPSPSADVLAFAGVRWG